MVQSQGGRSRPVSQNRRAEALTISEFAEAGDVGIETIRFYQRRDLLRTPPRGEGIRHYGPEDIRRLRFIRQAQTAGFTLEEIRELLDLDAGQDRARARELAKARIEALDTKIADLQSAREALQRLARECAGGKTGPCPILTSFKV
jgi:MerR family mercuric resistance operon transcriptional regulator